jgi:hypothetical protein
MICAIGAVRFDLNKMELGEEFYHVIDLTSYDDPRFDFSPNTFYWWMEQGEEAKKIFTSDTVKVGIKKALAEFSYFVKNSPQPPLIWGNGASFDNVIIHHAFEVCGFPVPWSHKQDVCFRTIRRMFPHTKVEEGIAHNALQDAKNQALTMIQIFSAFRGEFIP